EIRHLAGSNRPLFFALARKPTAALRVKAQGFFTTEAVFVRIHRNASDGFSGDQPVERNPWIVTRHTSCIRAFADGNAKLQHLPHRRCALGGLFAVAVHKVFALAGHAMLTGYAAAERLYAI